MAAAVRSLAGGLSRLVTVDVFVPGDGPPVADGAFDLTRLRAPSHAVWPSPDEAPTPRVRYGAVLVEADDHDARALARSMTSGAPVLAVGRADRAPAEAMLAVDLVDDATDASSGEVAHPSRAAEPTVHGVGCYARIHPGAAQRRHYGLRTTPDYLLVLGDRVGTPASPWPSKRVGWVLARFPRRHVVVVECGVARVWRSRSRVTEFEVHTRMDLWILIARAVGMVDLLPGDVFARECVEALRYRVPVVVPAGSAADGLVRRGGALSFASTAELLSCVDAFAEPATREALASTGVAIADHWYGDPGGLVSRLGDALASVGAGPARAG
jgi:hypothetical protein